MADEFGRGAHNYIPVLKEIGIEIFASAGTPTANGPAKGALVVDTTNAKLYINTGTAASATWNAVGDITASEITLAEGNLLVGNASGVATALSAKTSAQILVGNGTTLVSVAVSGDATISAAGVVTVSKATAAFDIGTNQTWAKEVNHTSTVTASTTATAAGGNLTIAAGAGNTTGAGGNFEADGGAGGNDAVGGSATLKGGAAGGGNRAGGAALITGGAGAGSAAGGAITEAAGQGGATGAGGAVTITSGAGGATSGASGDVTVATGTTTAGSGSATGAVVVQSGAGAASAAAVAGGASGAVTVKSQDGGANTGGATGQVGGAGGTVTVQGGAGGATNSTGAHAGGAGASVVQTAGAGGAASAGTGNGGAGGSFVRTAGAGGTSAGGTAGVNGMFFERATDGVGYLKKVPAPSAKTTNATLTAAEMLTGWITVNQAAGGTSTQTTPTGTQLVAAFPSTLAAGDSFDFHVINISTVAAEDAILAAGTDVSIVGNATVNSNDAIGTQSQGTFRFRYSGANVWVAYRIG